MGDLAPAALVGCVLAPEEAPVFADENALSRLPEVRFGKCDPRGKAAVTADRLPKAARVIFLLSFCGFFECKITESNGNVN